APVFPRAVLAPAALLGVGGHARSVLVPVAILAAVTFVGLTVARAALASLLSLRPRLAAERRPSRWPSATNRLSAAAAEVS
ncbi:MAG TPA: hypothetical protein VFW87_17825, partial [Pirellulales bacterium]|nr:hypothetical protein [Pirellulales bacterium]